MIICATFEVFNTSRVNRLTVTSHEYNLELRNYRVWRIAILTLQYNTAIEVVI